MRPRPSSVRGCGWGAAELGGAVCVYHRGLSQFFQDEIATPLGLDFYIRLPESIPERRLATLSRPGLWAMLRGFPLHLTLSVWNPRSNLVRALAGSMLAHDPQRIYARSFEVPAGGGVGTARAIAQAYGVFASGGGALGLQARTLQALAAPAVPPTRGFYDECMKGEGVQFALGFMRHCPVWPFGSAGSYGMPGTGGSLGFADPAQGIGYGYVTSRVGTSVTGDPRELALRQAVYASLGAAAA